MQRDDHNFRDEPNLNIFFADYLRGKSKQTVSAYTRCFKHWVAYCCNRWACHPHEIDYTACRKVVLNGKSALLPMRPDVILEFLAAIEASEGKGIRDRFHTCLSVYFSWLLNNGIIDTLPITPLTTKKKFPLQGPSEDQIGALLESVRSQPIEIKTLLSVMFGTGLRVGETCALRIVDLEEVAPNKWVIMVRRESNKTKTNRWFPVPGPLSPLLKGYLRWRRELSAPHDDHLFLRENGSWWRTDSVRSICVRLGLSIEFQRRLGPHDFRRGYVTVVAPRVSNPDIVAQLTGHKSKRMPLYYKRYPNIQDTRKATNNLDVVKWAEAVAEETAKLRTT